MSSQSSFPDFMRTDSDPAGRFLVGECPKILFHHQPKTAGSTFRQILENFFPGNEVCPAEIDDELKVLTADERARYRLYAGHYQYDTICAELPDAIWLTFVRNPIDRVVSNFYNLNDQKRTDEKWLERARARPEVIRFLEKVWKMDLDEFVDSEEPRARDRIVNRQTRYLVPRTKNVKQFPFYDKEIVETAKKNLREKFVYVGVQEYFAISLQLFCMTFGLRSIDDCDRFTANVNKVGKLDGCYDLPPRVRTRLEEQNAMDLEIWNYAQKLMFQRLARFLNELIEIDYVLRQEGPAETLQKIQHQIRVCGGPQNNGLLQPLKGYASSLWNTLVG